MAKKTDTGISALGCLIIFVLLVIVAGCNSMMGGDEKAAPEPAPTVTATETATATPKPSKEPEPEPEPEPEEEAIDAPELDVPEPEPEPEPGPVVYYKNCDAARAAGATPVHRGEPGYAKHLDRDGDGIGCDT